MNQRTVLIMAAGTGGHIFPALTIARELQSRNVHVEWLGTPGGMENDVLHDTDIRLHQLPVNGLRGKGKLALVRAPFMLLGCIWQSLRLLRSLQPCCVLGMGGYVTGPGGVAAWLLRKPLVIHEQNAVAGLSNRLLAPLARRVLEAFPGTFSRAAKVIHTGNPVRAEIRQLGEKLATRTDASEERPLRLLVLGGSLGAAAINDLMPKVASAMGQDRKLEVWHQTGRNKHESTLAAYHLAMAAGVADGQIKVEPFISDMAAAYSWADLVLCRAGASTVAEISAVGLPSVLVPYPYAVDDHQSANARWLADEQAAVLIQQAVLTEENLKQVIEDFMTNKARLQQMALNARTKAMPNAASRVADVCLEVCNG